MKPAILLATILFFLSCISGYLLSKASLVGRTGINLFYKEYKFLKTPWQGALLVFLILILLMFLQGMAQRKFAIKMARALQLILLFAAIAGLYFTYLDFREVLSHKLLGERFHIGAYLFWIGWMIISLFYLFQKPNRIFEEV